MKQVFMKQIWIELWNVCQCPALTNTAVLWVNVTKKSPAHIISPPKYINKSLRLTVVWNPPSPLRQWRVWQECVWSLSSLGSSAEWPEWSAACVWRPSSPHDWSPAVGCSLPQPLSSLHTHHTTTIRTRARSIVGQVELCWNLTDPLGWTGLRRSRGSACCRSSLSVWDWWWILRPPGQRALHLKRATAGASRHTHTHTHKQHSQTQEYKQRTHRWGRSREYQTEPEPQMLRDNQQALDTKTHITDM